MGAVKSILSLLTVVILVNGETSFALPSPSEKAPKAYAVFVASMDLKNQRFVGGVAGTAFFITPRKAVTAYHVLQSASFRPPTGFTRTQVWLVHENEPAIELKLSDLETRPAQDMTLICLDGTRAAPKRLVFDSGRADMLVTEVETEGFRANSTGPLLALNGDGLAITAVPRLERLSAKGELRQKIRVDLKANDVNLTAIPCLQLSYEPIVGLSGGPVVAGGRVVGMNSFADPRTRLSTWAVDLNSAL